MKRVNIFRAGVLVFGLVFLFSAVTYAKVTQGNIAESVFRLHIVANSNSDVDQRLKIAVRDRILKEAGELFENTDDAESAKGLAEKNIELLEKIAQDEILKQGFSYGACARVGEFAFPVKVYGDLMLPSGRYNALRITIGEGRGENWWCVMYPPMCNIENVTMGKGKEKLKASLSEEEYRIVSSKSAPVEIRFKIVDMINSII